MRRGNNIVCMTGPGHMTKIAAMPIIILQNLKRSRLKRLLILKLGTMYVAF